MFRVHSRSVNNLVRPILWLPHGRLLLRCSRWLGAVQCWYLHIQNTCYYQVRWTTRWHFRHVLSSHHWRKQGRTQGASCKLKARILNDQKIVDSRIVPSFSSIMFQINSPPILAWKTCCLLFGQPLLVVLNSTQSRTIEGQGTFNQRFLLTSITRRVKAAFFLIL